MEELKKAIKDKNLTLGSKKTLVKLKVGKVKNVFITIDCPEIIRRDIIQYGKTFETRVNVLDITASELGTLCKKQFSVSVLSY